MIITDDKGKKLFTIDKKEYNLAIKIKNKLLYNDSQWVGIYGGKVGSGKSLGAMRFAFLIDPTLSLERICFDKKEFVKAILGAKKGQVIIADEAISIFFSRAAMTKDNRTVMELMNQIRQKNLCLLLCIPNSASLDKLTDEMVNCYVHVWESRVKVKGKMTTLKGNRAYYINFPSERQATNFVKYQRAKIRGSKSYRPNYWLTVKGDKVSKTAWYPVSSKKYKQKKESVLTKYVEGKKEDNPKEVKARKERDKAIKALSEYKSQRELAKIVGLSKTGISDVINKIKEGGSI